MEAGRDGDGEREAARERESQISGGGQRMRDGEKGRGSRRERATELRGEEVGVRWRDGERRRERASEGERRRENVRKGRRSPSGTLSDGEGVAQR